MSNHTLSLFFVMLYYSNTINQPPAPKIDWNQLIALIDQPNND